MPSISIPITVQITNGVATNMGAYQDASAGRPDRALVVLYNEQTRTATAYEIDRPDTMVQVQAAPVPGSADGLKILRLHLSGNVTAHSNTVPMLRALAALYEFLPPGD